ncbi:uncharacterized protein LOC101234494 isoform X1 [Hydra vulgaris]|uniref:uncharacterized protein LOC101234494 isoform X1 n=1 Tax=Hydra vulgaris TaxID=6087 RepID=UPI001F5F279D|nr:uncharacterized protein LOC101234494 isoform X1 [Hydra vulgaris]
MVMNLFSTMVNNIKTFLNSPQSDVSPVSTDFSDIKVPKLYGSYSKRQQAKVVAFIRKGNSLRSAEKLFGIPKSTLHCWLKKLDSSPKESTNISTKSPEAFHLKNLLKKENTYSKSNDIHFSDQKNHINKEEKLLPENDACLEEKFIIEFLRSKEGVDLIAKAYNISVNDFIFFVSNLKKRVNVKEEEKQSFCVIQNQVTQSKHMSGNDSEINNNNAYECCNNYKRAHVYDSDSDSKIKLKKPRKISEGEYSSGLILKSIVQMQNYTSNQHNSQLSYSNPENSLPAFTNKTDDIPIYMKPCNESKLHSLEEKTVELHLGHSTINCNKETSKELHLGHSTINCNNEDSKEINRTNSEKELMALVAGENITADELCKDLNFSDLRNWVDNESWYTDQYLKYFRINPSHLYSTVAHVL